MAGAELVVGRGVLSERWLPGGYDRRGRVEYDGNMRGRRTDGADNYMRTRGPGVRLGAGARRGVEWIELAEEDVLLSVRTLSRWCTMIW